MILPRAYPLMNGGSLARVSLLAAILAVLLAAVALLTDSTEVWLAINNLLGEEVIYVLASLAVYVINPKLGFTLLASISLTASVNVVLKYALNLPRPPPEFWRAEAGGPGFPSGHTQVSATFWYALALFGSKYLTPLSVTLPAVVGLTRMALGVHYPLDVVGGYVLGALCALALYTLSRALGRSRTWAVSLTTSAVLLALTLYLGGGETALSLLGITAGFSTYLLTEEFSTELVRSPLPVKGKAFVAGVLTSVTFIWLSKVAPITLNPAGITLTYFLAGTSAVQVPLVIASLSRRSWRL